MKYIDDGESDADEYYRDVIGVTVDDGNRVLKIRFFKAIPAAGETSLDSFHWNKHSSALQ